MTASPSSQGSPRPAFHSPHAQWDSPRHQQSPHAQGHQAHAQLAQQARQHSSGSLLELAHSGQSLSLGSDVALHSLLQQQQSAQLQAQQSGLLHAQQSGQLLPQQGQLQLGQMHQQPGQLQMQIGQMQPLPQGYPSLLPQAVPNLPGMLPMCAHLFSNLCVVPLRASQSCLLPAKAPCKAALLVALHCLA